MKTQRRSKSILSALVLVLLIAISCRPGASKKTHEIPFTLERNKIMLPVRVGDSRVFNIILDTGMHFEGLLLYNIEPEDSVALENAIEVEVPGAGGGAPSPALMEDSMSFLVGDLEFTNQRLIILQSDIMQGFSSAGVTGYTLFGKYAVHVDYDRMVIALHESEIDVDSSWVSLPMIFKDYKIPWIDAAVNIDGEEDIPINCYIDLASSDALELLVKEEMKFRLPENLEDAYLGRGLSGDIYGHKGKIAALKLGSIYLEDVVTHFAPAEIRSKQDNADGIIGNNALRRFNVIFDYKEAKLYLKPNKYFSEQF